MNEDSQNYEGIICFSKDDIGHLYVVQENIENEDRPYLVTIIPGGEDAWTTEFEAMLGLGYVSSFIKQGKSPFNLMVQNASGLFTVKVLEEENKKNFIKGLLNKVYFKNNSGLTWQEYLESNLKKENSYCRFFRHEIMTEQIIEAIKQNPQYFGGDPQSCFYQEIILKSQFTSLMEPKGLEIYLKTGKKKFCVDSTQITDIDLVAYTPEKSTIFELKTHINVEGGLRTASDSGRYQVIKASMQLTKAAKFLGTNFDVEFSLVSVQGIKIAGEEIFISTRNYTYSTKESGLILVDHKSNVPLEQILSEAPKSHSQSNP